MSKKNIISKIVNDIYMEYLMNQDDSKQIVLFIDDKFLDVYSVVDLLKTNNPLVENQVAKIASKDKDFNRLLLEADITCDSCGYIPVKEFVLTKNDSRWIDFNKFHRESWVKLFKSKPFDMNVFCQKCPICEYEKVFGCGVYDSKVIKR